MNILNKIADRFGYAPKKKDKKRSIQASNLGRLTQSWASSHTNINADLRAGMQTLRTRARDLALNDPYGKKFINTLTKNVIGPHGFTHRNKAFDLIKENGEWTKKYDKLANNFINEAFADWSGKNFCTITEDISLREAKSLILKSIAMDGEVFIKEVKGKNINEFGYTLQVIEAAYVDETHNTVNPSTGNPIIMGIEYNQFRKPVAYYFRKTDVSKEIYNIHYTKEYVRIPAGQIIHLYIREYPGQLRGISWFVASAYRMQILKGYQEAVLYNTRAAASKTGVLVPKDEVGGSTEAADIAGGEENDEGDVTRELTPGEIFITPRGYNFDTFDPSFPSGQEGPFTAVIAQSIASGFDIDYPTIASDYSNVNYTSSRSAKLDSNLTYETVQNYLIEHLLKQVRTNWLEMAILTGRIKLPIVKFDKFNKPSFAGKKPDWTDQWKENKADAFGVDNNLETLESTLAKRGYNLEDFIEQKKYEKRLLQEAGLSVSDVLPNGEEEIDDPDKSDESGDNKSGNNTKKSNGSNGKSNDRDIKEIKNRIEFIQKMGN